ncbi:MAG: hypothetical protein A2Z21_08320, partial [Candidatus Fraserbacteria bacterium RBG_16_55_9]
FVIGLPQSYRFEYNEPTVSASILQNLGLSLEFYALYWVVFDTVTLLIFTTAATLIFWRKSDDSVALLGSFTLLAFGATSSHIGYPEFSRTLPWSWLTHDVTLLGTALPAVYLYLFPDGRFVPHWTRWLALIWAVLMLVRIVVPAYSSLLGLGPSALSAGTLLLRDGSGVLAQVYRYRRASTALQRQQTKWVVFGIVVTYLGVVLQLFTSVSPPPSASNVFYWLLFVVPLFYIPRILLAVCIGLALLRYRLWDIDFVINRSLVYGGLTLILAAIFGGSLIVISNSFQNLEGAPLVAVAVSAAIFGTMFQPARRNLQRFVDQRFYNIRIDYQKVPPPASVSVAEPAGITRVLHQERFGAYQGLEFIARGGMAEVYKSVHPTLGVPVAIKVLPAHLADDPEFRKRFHREGEVVSLLHHPNIVRMFSFGEENATHYMVMEWLSGKDLGRLLQEVGRLPLAQALPVIRDVAGALDYAHAQGLVHRDIKPSNVLLDCRSKERESGDKSPPSSFVMGDLSCRAVLTDFGIAKIRGAHTRMTRTGMLGTFDYIAPEQIQAAANVDGRADVYSFGIMVYEILTGELPFKHNKLGALLIAHLSQPPPDPRGWMPELSNDVVRALDRALAKSPEDRYPTAGQFAAALAQGETPLSAQELTAG